jgi:hypothetical protein
MVEPLLERLEYVRIYLSNTLSWILVANQNYG